MNTHLYYFMLLFFTISTHLFFFFFFFNDTATTEIYTLSLHDALPICCIMASIPAEKYRAAGGRRLLHVLPVFPRSEEHTSELQSPCNLVCRLLLEKKKKIISYSISNDIDTTSRSDTNCHC